MSGARTVRAHALHTLRRTSMNAASHPVTLVVGGSLREVSDSYCPALPRTTPTTTGPLR